MDDGYLALSGIQHFAFCKRQWALIHLEQAWADNGLTSSGQVMHRNAHNEDYRERRGDLLILRGLRVASRELGLSGACDVVEFHRAAQGFSLAGEEGLWAAVPVEYKRGKSKSIDADRLQLCAQALCLEEMLACDVPFGHLFYGQTRSREKVAFDEGLRSEVGRLSREMHALYERGWTPRVRRHGGCRSCSLRELCVPKGERYPDVGRYLSRHVEEADG